MTRQSAVAESLSKAPGGLANPSPHLLDLVKRARIHSRPFIGGSFVDPLTDETFLNISPINGAVINEVASCAEADVDRAVRSARTAFEKSGWPLMAPVLRNRTLHRFAEMIEEQSDELAILDAIDVGKPFAVTRSVDVGSTVKTVRWYAECVDKMYGEVAPTAVLDLVLREPLGVVGAVVPWNYPLMIAAWKFAPILAAGNAVILKPAEESPLSALRVAELACEAGIPPGIFNVVPGFGPQAGRALGVHPDVNGIAFTGSTEVGKKFLEYAANSNMKSVSLECGGKSPALILADADIDGAAAGIASGLFYNAGQSCNAPTRIVAHRSVSDAFVAALVKEAQAYYPGQALREDTKVGAIVNAAQLSRIEELVGSGLKDGVVLMSGGKRMFPDSGGFYYEPTVLGSAQTEMRVSQEEIFGPVVTVQMFDDLNDAERIANATRYGLWASVWTNDLSAAVSLARRIRAGTVAINNAFGGDITTPLGGFKESGTGRDRSFHALYKYTQLKHVHFNV